MKRREISAGLIIGVILGALVLPVYQGHASESKVSAAKSNLNIMRTQIELYKIHHNGSLPGFAFGSGVTTGTLAEQFTGTSTVDGATSSSANSSP